MLQGYVAPVSLLTYGVGLNKILLTAEQASKPNQRKRFWRGTTFQQRKHIKDINKTTKL